VFASTPEILSTPDVPRSPGLVDDFSAACDSRAICCQICRGGLCILPCGGRGGERGRAISKERSRHRASEEKQHSAISRCSSARARLCVECRDGGVRCKGHPSRFGGAIGPTHPTRTKPREKVYKARRPVRTEPKSSHRSDLARSERVAARVSTAAARTTPTPTPTLRRSGFVI